MSAGSPIPFVRIRPAAEALNRCVLHATVFLCLVMPLVAADFAELWKTGQYEDSLTFLEEIIDKEPREESWRTFQIENLLMLGRYPEAQRATVNTLSRFPTSLTARLLGYQAFRFNNEPERANSMLREINYLASSRGWAYNDPTNLVALGRTALLLGADAGKVLENFYDPIREKNSDMRAVWLATADLALGKQDFALASETLLEALKKFPEDPDILERLARALSEDDRGEMLRFLEAALLINPRHVDALLLLTDHLIDAEDYAGAREHLERVQQVNPRHPKAWAYLSVLHHLAGEAKAEAMTRTWGLWDFSSNPEVEHLIGLKLSQKYRFREGSTFQRQALAKDSEYLPAKIQLARDLLRIGQEEEGWRLAAEVYQADPYDISAYNLVTLRDNLKEYTSLKTEGFELRMHPDEARIYGHRVLELLSRARDTLNRKYGLENEQTTIVEVFRSQKDFAIRTFGMPGGAGFLGVCFGSLITANSPAALPSTTMNWEAVLWHEFCHVVTLTLTRNRMPRWLSEGISVYEELEANPSWGQVMNPEYRDMVLGEDLVPVSELSGAFLNPKSGMHLQFAYYQSSLVVRFLVERFGIASLRQILKDLGQGMEINAAIARSTEPMDKLEPAFEKYAQNLAKGLAPSLDWERPEVEDRVGLLAWAKLHPKNYYVLLQEARAAMNEMRWHDALTPLETLVEAYPNQRTEDGAHALLARVYEQLGREAEAIQSWSRLADLSGESPEAYAALLKASLKASDWKGTVKQAERWIAVQPLNATPHEALAQAAEEGGMNDSAVSAYRTLLALKPEDPARIHYQLARLLLQEDPDSARRHVLQALEVAPRYMEAHGLLLELAGNQKAQATAPVPGSSPAPKPVTPVPSAP